LDHIAIWDAIEMEPDALVRGLGGRRGRSIGLGLLRECADADHQRQSANTQEEPISSHTRARVLTLTAQIYFPSFANCSGQSVGGSLCFSASVLPCSMAQKSEPILTITRLYDSSPIVPGIGIRR